METVVMTDAPSNPDCIGIMFYSLDGILNKKMPAITLKSDKFRLKIWEKIGPQTTR